MPTDEPERSVFSEIGLVKALLAVMVEKAGGHAVITQSDLDCIAFTQLREERFIDGSIAFYVIEKPLVS